MGPGQGGGHPCTSCLPQWKPRLLIHKSVSTAIVTFSTLHVPTNPNLVTFSSDSQQYMSSVCSGCPLDVQSFQLITSQSKEPDSESPLWHLAGEVAFGKATEGHVTAISC